MSNHFRDKHGIQKDVTPAVEQSFEDYRMKLDRLNIPVIIKTGDQADGLRELVYERGKANERS